jgi:hypothetical protein
MKEKDILRMEGPFGSFFVREDSDKPMILLASGTGFAPIKAIIEHLQFKHAQDKRNQRQAVLYWGCRSKADIYLHDWALEAAAAMPNLTYIPVLSEPKPEWSTRRSAISSRSAGCRTTSSMPMRSRQRRTSTARERGACGACGAGQLGEAKMRHAAPGRSHTHGAWCRERLADALRKGGLGKAGTGRAGSVQQILIHSAGPPTAGFAATVGADRREAGGWAAHRVAQWRRRALLVPCVC